jgi:hypothetical protein
MDCDAFVWSIAPLPEVSLTRDWDHSDSQKSSNMSKKSDIFMVVFYVA